MNLGLSLSISNPRPPSAAPSQNAITFNGTPLTYNGQSIIFTP